MSDYLSQITRPEVQQFIIAHEGDDVQQLVLTHKEMFGIPSSWIATQIAGRRKAKEKLPTWYRTADIVFPPAINLEQCSSEITARYKQGLVNGHHAGDLTGGFGVDSYFFSQSYGTLDYVEPDESLLTIVRHNHELLGAPNIRYHGLPAEEFLKSSFESFDMIYLDPSRRAGGQKVFRLSDSSPDVVSLQQKLLERSRQVIIKASPLLDLRQACRELSSVDQIIVLAHENECKELLLVLRRGHANPEPTLHAVNLGKDGEPTPFAFTWSREKNARPVYGNPRTYLYEPNVAILKAGAFKLIAEEYGLIKLAVDSHLYTADEKHDGFPGRLFKVIEQVRLDKGLCERFDGHMANIIVRNYPLTVAEIALKTGLREGGTDYLICTRTEKPVVLIARRLR